MKTINIFGSTGSIGVQTLNIIRNFKNKFKVIGLSCGKNIKILQQQIDEFNPDFICVSKKEYIQHLRFKGKIFVGSRGLKEASNFKKVDISLIAIVGAEGLIPAYESIKNTKILALANKESLVAGGYFIIKEALKYKTKIIPVDSEHSAIFQCLHNKRNVSKIILTASGGPFFKLPKNQFKNITVEKALNHPTWNMGNKITIDSATLMNKGLEIIEAKWLFNLPVEKIEVIIHPQSIIHSMVEYSDGAIIAQLGIPDMEIPISFALFYPYRAKFPNKKLNFDNLSLNFYKPNLNKFPTLKYAYEAIKKGKGYPAALNMANEIAVEKFLNRKISFLEIFKYHEKIFDFTFPKTYNDIEDVFFINEEVKRRLT